ncbi:hypothetical protein LOCC1_G000022 [Lachnellula occidentalis]|uniref:CFEM domain-containing protein n=1 Tax=Lachnellula occidentalis TaxID=215460 RepID=A0A8H8S9G9_9HELO|nr:hypothetical protein LOCC1_G000022 [Lachnellula occidentalis]
MLSWNFRFSILALCILPHADSQFISSLPQCVQNCIIQSDDEDCSASDIKCLCRASAGNFLPDLITCMHGNCDSNLDKDAVLMPLQLACQIAGMPIPDSAMRNAQNRASSLAGQVTTTVTVGGKTGGSAAVATTSCSSDYIEPSVSSSTVIETQGVYTITLWFPVTILRTNTLIGSPSTGTISSSSTVFAATFKTTPASSIVSSTGAVSSSDLSTATVATSVALASTSSDGDGASKTSSAQSEDETNSSPFKGSNVGLAHRSVDGNWLGLAIVVVAMSLKLKRS